MQAVKRKRCDKQCRGHHGWSMTTIPGVWPSRCRAVDIGRLSPHWVWLSIKREVSKESLTEQTTAVIGTCCEALLNMSVGVEAGSAKVSEGIFSCTAQNSGFDSFVCSEAFNHMWKSLKAFRNFIHTVSLSSKPASGIITHFPSLIGILKCILS